MSKKIIIDLDKTICTKIDGLGYERALPRIDVIAKMHQYRKMGFGISVFTARNMRTFKGNLEKINTHTLPLIITWLGKYNVPYDEVIVGKPWCGHDGFYIDDRAIRPSEFLKFSVEEINVIFNNE